jgi:inosose dehydratase
MTKINIAAAPISWGVCEVPGWGHQMEPDRVLTEMGELGFAATEFGPEGFLPQDPQAKAELLAVHGMTAVGGFVPVLLHSPEHDPLPEIRRELVSYELAGAKTIVLSAVSGQDGYDARPELDESGWATLLNNLERAREAAAAVGVTAVLHPHAGTMVETSDDVDHVLEGSSIGFCFDTGHLFIGGTDPVSFAAEHADRILHAHLKDVSLEHADRVRQGQSSYYDEVVAGMYKPLGQGDIDIAAIVNSLLDAGYTGWFTLEQDNVVSEQPAPGEGPVSDAAASLAYLRSVAEGHGVAQGVTA